MPPFCSDSAESGLTHYFPEKKPVGKMHFCDLHRINKFLFIGGMCFRSEKIEWSAHVCYFSIVADQSDINSSAVAVNTTRVARGVRQATAQEARRARKAATELRFWQTREQYRRRGPRCTSA